MQLDAATGRQQWVANISPTDGYLPPGTIPAVTDDTIFLGSCALNAATGAVRWLQRDLGSRADSTVALSQDRSTVYVPTDDGNLTALAAATGVVKWGLNLQIGVDVGPPSGPAVSADGTLFVGTRYNCGNYMNCDGDLLAITAP
jgi:outer membrane protein assembly factor BamB